jgi:Big-like domain-containing protein
VSGYRLEVGEGAAPTRWTLLGSGPAAPGSRLLGTWDAAGLGGVYTLRLTLLPAGGGEGQAILNRVTVDNAAPVAWIAWPSDPADVTDLAPGERFIVQAEAQDNYGVAAVRFSAGGQSLGRRTSAPWSLLVDPGSLGPGRHQISAVAVDRAGNESEPVTVTIITR